MDDTVHQDHIRAKSQIEALYDATVAVVGDGWDRSEHEWRACSRSSLSELDSWSRANQRFGPLNASPHEVAALVAGAWRTLGYDVTVVDDDTLAPPRDVVSFPTYLTGTTEDGFGAVFSVGENYADFRGHSRCVTPYPDLLDRYPDNETDQ